MLKAKIIGDTITPDFEYHIVKIECDIITLGWYGRRGFWNETKRHRNEIIFVEAEEND